MSLKSHVLFRLSYTPKTATLTNWVKGAYGADGGSRTHKRRILSADDMPILYIDILKAQRPILTFNFISRYLIGLLVRGKGLEPSLPKASGF